MSLVPSLLPPSGRSSNPLQHVSGHGWSVVGILYRRRTLLGCDWDGAVFRGLFHDLTLSFLENPLCNKPGKTILEPVNTSTRIFALDRWDGFGDDPQRARLRLLESGAVATLQADVPRGGLR